MRKRSVLQLFQYVRKSKFIRTIFFETIAIFLVVIVLTVTLMFVTFGMQVNRQTVSDQRNRLELLEENLSSRMEEITSISYNIGADPMFLLEPVDGVKYSGYEMAGTLSRYLVGNRFIKHIAFYRLSEPDVIYSSSGEMTLKRFWDAYLTCDNYTRESFIDMIKSQNGVQLIPISAADTYTYYVYVCPLPQFSMEPQAFVIALIPQSEISGPVKAQMENSFGTITVFDAKGDVVYSMYTPDDKVDFDMPGVKSGDDTTSVNANGREYSLQWTKSQVNSWAYVSAIRINGVFDGLNVQQILIMLSLIVLVIVSIFVILLSVIRKYIPISNLAMALTGDSEETISGPVDERDLISNRIETLKIDSEQKQKYEVAYNAASEASKAKSAFLSNMSHDIRTPMNAVIGMIGLAKRHSDNPEYVADCLLKADVASHYLLDLINNVLDMSRIESGKVVIASEPVCLPDLFYGMITIANSSVGQKNQRLIVDTDSVVNETVLSDNLRLTQICMNILTNAVKYTGEGGTIRIQIKQSASDLPGFADYTFTFSDTGIGMSPEFIDRVFEPFNREVKSGVSKVEGTGLGMAIVKNLVDMMNGTITCESETGVGTTFVVSLTLETVPEQLPEMRLPVANPSILIVCDDADVCGHQSELFRSLNFETDYCMSSDEMFDKIGKKKECGSFYTYILTDLVNDGNSWINRLAKRLCAEGENTSDIILAASEFSVLDGASIESDERRIFMRTPLFRTKVINTLNRKEENDSAGNADDEHNMLLGVRVLLAEDNDMNRLIATKILTEEGAEVVEACNGSEAVREFTSRPAGYFNVILMDVQMPEMDGMTATRAIRSLDRRDAKDIAIYAMTANTFDEDVREVLKCGMNGHLGKPYSPDDLYKILREVSAKNRNTD